MEAGASGDISIVLLRRNGTVTVPVYLWLGSVWVDVATLTSAQFSTYVDARLATLTNPNGQININNPDGTITVVGQKVDGLTITRTQF